MMASSLPEPKPVWFITAASSGFGQHIALEALSRSHIVIASARKTSSLDLLASKGAHVLALDVTWPLPKIEAIAKEAVQDYGGGRLNHLVNAAGYVLFGAVEENSPQEDYDSFNSNVLGMLNVSKAFLPYLRAMPATEHRTIANFGSLASWGGGPGWALYAGAKWAVSGISEGMHAELAPLGIAVTVIEPGYFRTGFLSSTAKVDAEKRIEAYEGTAVGEVRKMLEATHNNQPGDVVKGCKIIVDILTMTGVADGRKVPMRVALGKDAHETISMKLDTTRKLLDDWADVVAGTEHD